MLFSSVHDLSDRIARNHFSFNGRECSFKSSVMVFDTLMRCVDFLRKEPAAVSCEFPAVLDANCVPVNTVITISVSEDGVICEERVS